MRLFFTVDDQTADEIESLKLRKGEAAELSEFLWKRVVYSTEFNIFRFEEFPFKISFSRQDLRARTPQILSGRDKINSHLWKTRLENVNIEQ